LHVGFDYIEIKNTTMIRTISISIIAILATISCSSPKTNEGAVTDKPMPVSQEFKVTKQWETDTLLSTAESVLYLPDAEVLLVACINGRPLDKDGNGFIAQVDLDGNILNEKWAIDLDAPKGMGVYQDKLYVTNITQLVEIALPSGEVSNRWEVEGSVFLNDVSIDKEGIVYFTDSNTNKIHALKDGVVTTWLEGTEITGFNGLLAEDNGLMLASMGSSNFAQINWDTKTIVVKTDSIGAGDGVATDGKGNYLVSSWAGEVFFINGNDWSKSSLLRTQEDKIQAADITYIPEKNLLLVPTFFKNSVTAYRMEVE
jgi:hypothetical protein